MLEVPDQPSAARVLRVQPSPEEQPAPGFSWADYEDVQTAAAEDADGEDDGGWGVVKSRGRNSMLNVSILILFTHSYVFEQSQSDHPKQIHNLRVDPR